MDLKRNQLLGSIKFPNNINNNSPLMIVMCGLPGTGKTTLVKSITRILNWKNQNIEIFNLEKYKRKQNELMEVHTDFTNQKYLDDISTEQLNESIFFLKNSTKGNTKNIAFFDENNSTTKIRKKILDTCHLNVIQVMFIESQLDVINIEEFEKTKWVQYKNTDFKYFDNVEEAYQDFNKKVLIYKQRYIPLSVDPNNQYYSYISIDKNGVYSHLIDSYVPLLVSSFISSKFKYNVGNNIYLCRHGESIANTKGIIGGNYDITESGRHFGKLLGKYMVENKPNGLPIWTSTLIRTINTALECQSVAGGNNKLLQWPALDEIHGGMFEECTFDYVKKNYPKVYQDRKNNKFNFVYPNRGESYEILSKRIEPVILCMERQTSDILIICHTAVLRMLLCYLLDKNKEDCTTLDIPLNRLYKITKGYCSNSCEEIDLL